MLLPTCAGVTTGQENARTQTLRADKTQREGCEAHPALSGVIFLN